MSPGEGERCVSGRDWGGRRCGEDGMGGKSARAGMEWNDEESRGDVMCNSLLTDAARILFRVACLEDGQDCLRHIDQAVHVGVEHGLDVCFLDIGRLVHAVH